MVWLSRLCCLCPNLSLFLQAHLFFEHGIELILFIDYSSFGPAPACALLFQVLTQFDLLGNLAPKEVPGCLFRVKIAPLGILIIVFVIGLELGLGASWPEVLLLMTIVATLVVVVLVASLVMIVTFVLVLAISSSILLQRLVGLFLSSLNTFRQKATLV